MVNDHLSDFITRVRNSYMAGAKSMEVTYSKVIFDVAEVMAKSGYLNKVVRNDKKITISLKYEGKQPAIMGIKRVSKPGARVYSGIKDLSRVWGGLGMNILSTPGGIMGDREAKKVKKGGEVIAQVW